MVTLPLSDKRSALMRRLVDGWVEELAALRARNDDKNLGDVETAFVRGRIAQLKADIALANESIPVVTEGSYD